MSTGPVAASRVPEGAARKLLTDSAPPQNLDAERAVLGSVLRDNLCMTEIVKFLAVEHFYSASNQKIYSTMRVMFDDAKPIDPYTLGEELEKRGWLKENDVDGARLVRSMIELYDETYTAANVGHYAKIVYDKGVIRHLIHVATEILRDAYENAGSADDLLEDAERKIFAILEKKIAGNVTEMADVIGRVFDRISDRESREGSNYGGVASGFADLDELTDGWQNSELTILAARPSMGKTALALNMVEHAAIDCALPSLFVSLEMSELELVERLLCTRGKVNGHALRRGRVTSDDMQDLIRAGEELRSAPIYVDDTPGLTMTQINATARRLQHRHGLRLVVIDYLQLIEPDDRRVPRQEQISTISRRLKGLARELQCPVIALSQLNRAAEARKHEGHRPRMSDLRESGSIEQDADVVLLLHRDEQFDPQLNPGQADLILAKQRNGPVGDVKLTFRKELTRFESFHVEMAPFGDASEPF